MSEHTSTGADFNGENVRPVEVAATLAVELTKRPLSIMSHGTDAIGERTQTTEASWASVGRDASGPAYVLLRTEGGQQFRLFIVEERPGD